MTIMALLSGLLVLWAASGAAAVPIDGIAAIVGGEVISKSELERLLPRQADGTVAVVQPPQDIRKVVLEQIIDRRLILREATRRNIQPTDADIEAALDDIQKRNNLESRQALQNVIMQEGRLSWQAYIDDLRHQVSLFRLVGGQMREVTVASDETRVYYEAHREKFMTADEIHLDRIRFRPLPTDTPPPQAGPSALQQRVDVARTALQNGAVLNVLVEKYGAEVTDLGTVNPKDLAPQITERVGSLLEGETSEPLPSDSGIDLFRIRSRRPPQPIPFEESVPAITEFLLAEKRAAVQTSWLQSLRNTTRIEIR